LWLLFSLWQFYFESHAPSADCKVDLLITIPRPDRNVESLVKLYANIFQLDKYFSMVNIRSLNIDPCDDVYFRDLSSAPYVPKWGTKSGPNLQFFHSMEILRLSGYDAVLLNESDAYPLRKDWLSLVKREFLSLGSSPIIGSLYHGKGNIPLSISGHANGNSLYVLRHWCFRCGLLEQWRGCLEKLVKIFPDQAYDTTLSLISASISSDINLCIEFPLVLAAARRSTRSLVLKNFSLSCDILTVSQVESLANIGTAILHGKCNEISVFRSMLRRYNRSWVPTHLWRLIPSRLLEYC
jgi:hypothetical protein